MQKTYEFPGYEYKWVNVPLTPHSALQDPTHGATIEEAANYWAGQGWRTVSVIQATGIGHSDTLLIERVKQNPHSPIESEESFEKWREWDEKYGGPWDRRAQR